MDEPQQEYREFLDQIHGMPEGITDDRTGWAVRDDGSADWALRRLARLQASMSKRAAYVASEIARLKAWQQHEDAQEQRSIDFFTAHLQRYADALVAEGVIHEKKRSYKLPHGTLAFRAKGAEFEITNTDELLCWAKHTDPARFVAPREEVLWGEIKKALVVQENGAVTAEMVNPETGEVWAVEVGGVRVKAMPRDEFKAIPSVD
jgi:phage host-nuclease inhibitor protein Gam